MIDWYVGQPVTRFLGGTIAIALKVIKVEPHLITCALADDAESVEWDTPTWDFDPATGAEVDDLLNWGPPPKATGSYIKAATVVLPRKEGTHNA